MLAAVFCGRPQRTRVDIYDAMLLGDATWEVPSGITEIRFNAAARGGAMGSNGDSVFAAGGGGGWMRGVVLAVTPGEILTTAYNVGGTFTPAFVTVTSNLQGLVLSMSEGLPASNFTDGRGGLGGGVTWYVGGGTSVLGGAGGGVLGANGSAAPAPVSVSGGVMYGGGGGGAAGAAPSTNGGRGGASTPFVSGVPSGFYATGGAGWFAGQTPDGVIGTFPGVNFVYVEY